MNPWRTILLRARPGLITLTCAIAISLAMVFGSNYVEGNLHKDLQQSRNQASAQRTSLEAKQQDLLYIEAHIDEFRTLKKQGLLSMPDREGWVEQLLAAQKQLKIPETLVYALPPAVPMSNGTSGASGAETEAAPDAPLIHDLEINLRDIHEEELLALLQEFQARIHDRFRLQSCRLFNPISSGLSAQCTLRFFTLPPAPGAGNS